MLIRTPRHQFRDEAGAGENPKRTTTVVSSSNNIIRARKRCVKCGHALGGRGRAYDDVPLSWSALACPPSVADAMLDNAALKDLLAKKW
jgi:hypothetical protein